MKAQYLSQAWLVLLLALTFGAALAGVEVWLAPKIAANKLNATIDQIPELVQGADRDTCAKYKPVEVVVGEGNLKTTYEAFWALDASANPLGWVIKAAGQGFADKIEILIGVDSQVRTIKGMAVLSQKETPGLGNKIEAKGTQDKPGFRFQFFAWGHKADRPLAVTTASPTEDEYNKIKAVAGATVSSKAVCNIINEALAPPLREALVEALAQGPELRQETQETKE